MDKQTLNIIIGHLDKLHLKNIDEDDICCIFTNLLLSRNLLKECNTIEFGAHNLDVKTSDAAIYDSNKKRIIMDMDKLKNKKLFTDNSYFRDLSYFQVLCLYEILVGVERVYINNLDKFPCSQTLKELTDVIELFNKKNINEEDRYFDIDDADLKLYNLGGYDPKRSLVDTLPPLERYVKLKALFDTKDLFKCVKPASDNLKLFFMDNADLIANGYTRECNEIMYPVYNFFTSIGYKRGKKFLKKLSWYNPDYYKMLSSVSGKYNFETRLVYGMPIDVAEYEYVRKLSRGGNLF